MEYKEFLDLIRNKVKALLKDEPTEKVEALLEEQEYWIHDEYKIAIDELKAGKITAQELKVGRVARVANCVYYLY